MLQRDSRVNSNRDGREGRKILVVGRGDVFSKSIMDYSIRLAERLSYGLLAVSVLKASDAGNSSRRVQRFSHGFSGTGLSGDSGIFKRKAEGGGVSCDVVVKYGDLGVAVAEVSHEIKRAEFVLIDQGVSKEQVASEVTIPVFSVTSTNERDWEGESMARQNGVHKKPVIQTVGYGLLTAGMYAAVFSHSDMLMRSFTSGGLYAALPIATAFAFSFSHGAFSSHLWSLLGIEARKTQVLRQTEKQVVRQRKPVRQRPRIHAYVNPFHRM